MSLAVSVVIAHRGRPGPGIPENTLTAFGAAADAGAAMVELDVRYTADHELAIFHDPLCGRTPLDQLTLAELRERTGIEVPTLPAVVAWATRSGLGLDVELKEDGYVDTVVELLLRFATDGGNVLVTSFDDAVLGQLPLELPSGLLLSFTAMRAGERARACGASALVVEHKLLSEAVIADAAAHGLQVYVWDYLPDRDGPDIGARHAACRDHHR